MALKDPNQERTEAELRNLAEGQIKDNWHRIWFREKYNLPPTDPRYLEMTDEGILVEFEIQRSIKRERDAQQKRSVPHCPECDFMGAPYPNSTYCPRCGAEMTIPEGSDQTDYVDDDFAQTVKDELGIDLPDI